MITEILKQFCGADNITEKYDSGGELCGVVIYKGKEILELYANVYSGDMPYLEITHSMVTVDDKALDSALDEFIEEHGIAAALVRLNKASARVQGKSLSAVYPLSGPDSEAYDKAMEDYQKQHPLNNLL